MNKDNKPELFFFIQCAKGCPYNFYKRLVFSLIKKYEYQDRTSTMVEAAKLAHVDVKTITKYTEELVDEPGNRWLIQCKDNAIGYEYFLLESNERYNLIQNAILSFLKSLSKTQKLHNLSYSYIAGFLGLDRRVVWGWMSRMKDAIKIIPTSNSHMKRMNRFDVIFMSPAPVVERQVEEYEEYIKMLDIQICHGEKGNMSHEKGNMSHESPNMHIVSPKSSLNLNKSTAETFPAEEKTETPPAAASEEHAPELKEVFLKKIKTSIDTMEKLGFTLKEQKSIVSLFTKTFTRNTDLIYSSDYSGYVIDTVQKHKQNKKPGTGAKLVIYLLELSLGLRQATQPKPKPKLTPEQVVQAQMQRMFKEADRDAAGLCSAADVAETLRMDRECRAVDMSIPYLELPPRLNSFPLSAE